MAVEQYPLDSFLNSDSQYPLDSFLHNDGKKDDSLLSGDAQSGLRLPPPAAPAAPSPSLQKPVRQGPSAAEIWSAIKADKKSKSIDFNSPDFRTVGNIDETRRDIFARALEAASNIPPIANSRYTLQLTNVGYQGPETCTKAEHKKAIMRNTYLTRRMTGVWTLTDNATGKVVSKKPGIIAHIPYMTPLGTFAKGGNDYALMHQFRLKPGIYTRWQDNGELEAHVNATNGLGHRVYLEPKTGIFKVKFGQSSLPAADVLGILGAKPEQLKEAWGDELYRANTSKTDPKALNKLYQKLTYGRGTADSPEAKARAVQESFAKLRLDPDVTAITLGKPYDHVGVDTLLDTTKKLLRVNKGESEEDSRDDTAFQKLLGPDDIIAERLEKGTPMLRQLLWKISGKGDLNKVPNGVFDKLVDSALIGTGLGMPLEEVNPIELMDSQYRVTRLGEGGISSIEAIPESARNVHPSHMGFVDILRTPESLKAGVDARMAYNLKKSRDGLLYAQLITPTGDKVWKSTQDVSNAVVAFPNELARPDRFIAAIHRGKMSMVPRETVQYAFPYMQEAEHTVGTMVPMQSAVKGQRAIMAARMLTQALPLKNPESPWVQAGIPDEEDRSYEEKFGDNMGAVHATDDMQVVSVDPEKIILRNKKGEKSEVELYNNFVFNRKTGFTQTPVVQPGDTVKKGQLLARSNFTDDKGTTAVGANAVVAYLPFKGKNYEDAIVISEDFAKRMTSTHYYKNKLPISNDTITGKQRFLSIKPGRFNREQLDNFTDDGVIKPGTVVNTGDPLVLGVSKVALTEAQKKAGRRPSFKDVSVTWEHHDPGVVTDVYMSPKGAQVMVQTEQPMREADKLSQRYGAKGVVGYVASMDELPSLPDGSKPDILMSPLSLVGRVNPAQIVEAMLGKVAAKTGKRYAVKDFSNGEDYTEYAQNELKKHGLSDTEELLDTTDPDNPKRIPNVLVGNAYYMKLHHTSESKAQSRGIGSYTTDQQPAKGGDDGAKRMGMMELNALLGHGAVDNINDLRLVKGQENLDYWRQYMAGYNPATPKVPYVYSKFVDYLKGSGINVVREGPRLQLMAMTGKDIDTLTSGNEITGIPNARTGLRTLNTVAWDDNMKTVKGGLFDDKVTGGHGGNKWSYFKVGEKLLNPVMELPLRLMLGLTEEQTRNIIAGKEKTPYGTGPDALYQMAKKIDINTEIIRARNDIDSGKRTQRDAAIKRLGYLKSTKLLKQEPADWFTDKIPVVPPYFRPVAQLGSDKLPLVSDPNIMYKDLFDANQTYMASKKAFGASESGDLALAMYDSFKALTGIADPTNKELQTRGTKGLLKAVFGDGPKYSMIQRQLLGMPVDFSGRAVITPNPDYDMDTVGIPENIAWDTYKPFIIRHLRQYGRNGIAAIEEVEKRTPAARDILREEMESRPVMINRAPTLHKYGFMALYPKLIKGDNIRLNPFVFRGYNADCDGDAVQFHVPTTKEAVDEAINKMLPSRNLLTVSDFTAQPNITKELLVGLYEGSRKRDNDKTPPRVFATKADALKAWREGRVGPTDKVKILK